MTRYVGTGDGGWHGPWYCYIPSLGDHRLAKDVGAAVARRVNARGRTRTGYGAEREAKPEWYSVGFLGEVAALHPLRAGPDLDAWHGRQWYGRGDYGPIEIRTTSSFQLMGGNARYPGLGGWRVTAKDAGRIILCVEDRSGDYVAMGWQYADDAPRLIEPAGKIVAVIEPPDLRPLAELAPYAELFR